MTKKEIEFRAHEIAKQMGRNYITNSMREMAQEEIAQEEIAQEEIGIKVTITKNNKELANRSAENWDIAAQNLESLKKQFK